MSKDAVSHAYIFSGPRGTGKTTLARIFARAVNCQRRKTSEPCNSCEVCLEILNGSALDIIEIDAASNRGIDEIRDLREKVTFAPSRSTYKVYIIDEVHMLTKEAFNALLKTLEEPPQHVIFILATTELHKVPETIISRCQRFHFHRASSEAIKALLDQVVKAEKLPIDEEALSLIIQRAEGSYRDALTLLGNLQNVSETLTAEALRRLIGLPELMKVKTCLDYILSGQSEKLAKFLNEMILEGVDLTVLSKSLVDTINQNLFEESGAELAKKAKLLEQLLLGLARSRVSADPTTLLVAELINLSLTFAAGSVGSPSGIVTDVQKPSNSSVEEIKTVDSVKSTMNQSVGFWSELLEKVKQQNHALYAVLRSAQLESLTENEVVVAVKFRFYLDRLQESRNKKIVETAASQVVGRALRLKCVVRPDIGEAPQSSEDPLAAVVEVFELEETE